jgi:hypothetical protein
MAKPAGQGCANSVSKLRLTSAPLAHWNIANVNNPMASVRNMNPSSEMPRSTNYLLEANLVNPNWQSDEH